MAVVDAPGKCRCATPIELQIRLKSPSFSFFERFKNEFYGLVTKQLNLTDSQVHLGKYEWQAGPRLFMLMYLFPVNQTFDPTEYERLFKFVANWDMSADADWALSVIGPYELLSFREGIHIQPRQGFSHSRVRFLVAL